MRLNKRNKRELRKICLILALIGVVFLWAVGENIGFPIPTNIDEGRIQVIDVSSYNGRVNWKKVKDQKINHAMLRIGTGIDSKRKGSEDERFGSNYRSASYASIHTGVYYYSYASTEKQARQEARHCLSLLRKYGIDPQDLDLPVAFDIEEESVFETGRENVTKITEAFCEEIKEAGYTPMIYSGASALKSYFIYDRIKDYEIWVAHYTEADAPSIPFPYRMWQYTSSASVEGANTAQGRCDINYYQIEEG